MSSTRSTNFVVNCAHTGFGQRRLMPADYTARVQNGNVVLTHVLSHLCVCVRRRGGSAVLDSGRGLELVSASPYDCVQRVWYPRAVVLSRSGAYLPFACPYNTARRQSGLQ